MTEQSTDVEQAESSGERPGSPSRRSRSAGKVLAAAAVVAIVVAGAFAATRLVEDDAATSPSDGRAVPGAPAGAASAAAGLLPVSSTGVGDQPFGTAAGLVVAALTASYGDPDRSTDPNQYVRIPGQPGWFEVAGDPLSPSWDRAVTATSCWDPLCVVFGGDAVETLQLTGWTLTASAGAEGAGSSAPAGAPDVLLADSGIRLGDTWEDLHAAYPATIIAGGEGASVSVRNLPWPAVFDGVGAWRLSGQWDYTRPTQAPDGAVVTRLSGGEGPEPGCC